MSPKHHDGGMMVDYKDYGKRDNIFKRAWALILDNIPEIIISSVMFVFFICGLLMWIESLPDAIK